MRRRRQDSVDSSRPAPTPVELVRAATKDYERARRNRDAAIAHAKRRGQPQREIAEAAGLSVGRVKQIVVDPLSNGAKLPPVPEMDLPFPSGADGDDHDRVFALETVDPWLHRWASEREFLAEDQDRQAGNRTDLAQSIYDLNPGQRWVVVYANRTREVYAFAHEERAGWDAVSSATSDIDMTKGSTSGPCVLLGHAYSIELLDTALGFGIYNVLHRPGGLAWVYGRVRLLNALLSTAASPISGLIADPTAVWRYLQDLPDNERPR